MQVPNVNFTNSNDVNIPDLNITLLTIQRNPSTIEVVLPEKLTVPIQQFLEPSNNYSLLYHVCMHMHKSVDNNTILSEQSYTMHIDPTLHAVVSDIKEKYNTIFMHVRNIALTQKQNKPVSTNKVCLPPPAFVGASFCVKPAGTPAFPISTPITPTSTHSSFCSQKPFVLWNQLQPQLIIPQRTVSFSRFENNCHFPEQFWF